MIFEDLDGVYLKFETIYEDDRKGTVRCKSSLVESMEAHPDNLIVITMYSGKEYVATLPYEVTDIDVFIDETLESVGFRIK